MKASPGADLDRRSERHASTYCEAMAFTPSHRVPPSGLPTWAVPDTSSPQGPRLDPGLEVQVLGQQGALAHITCSNSWEAWIPFLPLEAMAQQGPSVPPPPGPPHVGPGGTPAPFTPTAPFAAAPAAQLTPPVPFAAVPAPLAQAAAASFMAPAGLNATAPFQGPGSVFTTAQVPVAPSVAQPPPPGYGYQPVAPGIRAPRAGRAFAPGTAPVSYSGIRLLPLIGAVAAVVSGFLPWLSYGGANLSAFRAPLRFLFGSQDPGGGGPDIGYAVLAAAALAAAGALYPRLRVLARIGAMALVAMAALFVVQAQRRLIGFAPGGESVMKLLGSGVYVAAAAGLLVLFSKYSKRVKVPPS
jgi:hypothetical protein